MDDKNLDRFISRNEFIYYVRQDNLTIVEKILKIDNSWAIYLTDHQIPSIMCCNDNINILRLVLKYGGDLFYSQNLLWGYNVSSAGLPSIQKCIDIYKLFLQFSIFNDKFYIRIKEMIEYYSKYKIYHVNEITRKIYIAIIKIYLIRHIILKNILKYQLKKYIKSFRQKKIESFYIYVYLPNEFIRIHFINTYYKY